MRGYLVTFSLLVIALAGCATTATSPPRIDGSTPATLAASWKALEATLNSEQKTKLDTAVLLIGATKFHDSGFKEPASFGPETLRSELDGKTYDEIIKAAAATGTRINVTDTVKYADSVRAQGHPVRATFPIWAQILAISFPKGFVPVTEKITGPQYLHESVPVGESVDDWSQMITIVGNRGVALQPNVTVDNAVDYFVGVYRKACPDSLASMDLGSGGLDQYGGRVMIVSCGAVAYGKGPHGESMLLIVLRGSEDYYVIQWATRGPPRPTPPELSRGEWEERLQRLKPIKICDRGEAPPYPSCLSDK
jgi:hypothetical protein